jgi:putative membrane protein
VGLDPRSIPCRALQSGTRILGGLLFVLVAGASSGNRFGSALGMVGLLVAVVAVTGIWQYAYYRRFTYEVTPDTFDINSGVLSRREREIPYDRIQNVDVAQNAVQRALGIAEVRLETAGGQETEAQLRYVSRPEADRLQEVVSERKRDRAGDALHQ